MKREFSIRRELTRTFMLAVAVSAILAASVVAFYAGDRISTVVRNHVHTTAQAFANRASLAVLTRDKEMLQQFAASVLESSAGVLPLLPRVQSIVLADPGWRTVYASGPDTIPTALRSQVQVVPNMSSYVDEVSGEMQVLAPVMATAPGNATNLDKDARLFGYLYLQFDRSGLDQFINSLRLGGAFAGLILGAVIVAWLRFRITRLTVPLTRLVVAMSVANERSSGVRVELTGPTELKDMADAFNSMMVRIERAQRDLEDAVKKATSEAQAALAIARNESTAKSDLLTRVSHEFRQPLNNIMAYAQTISHKLSFVDAPVTDLTDDVKRVEDNTARLARLVDDLLLVRQMARERLSAQFSVFSIGTVVREVVAEVQPVCDARGNIVECLFTGNDEVLGDREKIRIVLSNLLGNSAKFTDYGSITVLTHVTATELKLDVIDTGIGIDPSSREEIFEIFFRGSADVVRGYPGVGVGLWIVRELVNLMGGSVGLHPEVTRGSHFKVRLPLGPSTGAQSEC